jgi:hypothetical protein
MEVERLLCKVKPTASNCDGIPAWLLRSCSYEFAEAVAHILNCSFSSGRIPSCWLNALVTPVSKVTKPTSLSDFRPISVTPHVSRIAEKYVVKRGLRPSIPAQCAFEPTGGTTAALVHFMHKVTQMLDTGHNSCVRCMLYYLNKLTKFSPPAFVVNLICSSLTNRGQQCKFNGPVSNILKICLSIVQGSGIGPTRSVYLPLFPLPICNGYNGKRYAGALFLFTVS